MKNFSLKILFLIVALAQTTIFAQSGELERLENLFQNRQYFDLRDALGKYQRDDSTEILFYRGAIANRFNEVEKSISLLQKYIKKADRNATNLDEAYEILADNHTKSFEYGKAADAYKFLLDNFRANLDAERIKNYENVFGLWNALRGVPRQIVSFDGDSVIEGTRDIAKLLNIPIEINNQKMDFVFDTGANISTITLSTANKLGLKIIESDVSIGSSTDIKVKSKLAVAPAMRIGNAAVRNVVFLVLEDKSLYFPQVKYQINGIIGFPVMKSLGNFTIAKNNQVLIRAKTAKSSAEPNMCLEGLTPLVAAFYKNRRMIFAFDTGAVTTDFYPAFLRANEAEIKQTAAAQKTKVGGAGGYREVAAYNVKDLEISVGGKPARLPNARILSEQTNEQSRYFYGNLGQDLIKQFERMTLDFRSMRITFD